MKNILLVLLVAVLPISILSQTTYYEINLNVTSYLMGEDILKLGSDVKINTKEKTIEECGNYIYNQIMIRHLSEKN